MSKSASDLWIVVTAASLPPLPVNYSHRPDLENLTVSNPSLEAYDELTQDPDEKHEPES